MLKFKHFVAVCLFVLGMSDALAADMRGTIPVNITSDTATAAKNIAFDEARRQIISDSVRQYVDVAALQELMSNTKSSDLVGLISSIGIDGEQTSDTTYSANVSMVLDVEAVRKWLNDNGVQNWIPDAQNQDMFTAVIKMSDALQGWGEINQIARDNNISLETQNIVGDTVTVLMPVSMRGTFTIAVRGAGWKYADKDGKLNIWK
jgi:hypothetical protein